MKQERHRLKARKLTGETKALSVFAELEGVDEHKARTVLPENKGAGVKRERVVPPGTGKAEDHPDSKLGSKREKLTEYD